MFFCHCLRLLPAILRTVSILSKHQKNVLCLVIYSFALGDVRDNRAKTLWKNWRSNLISQSWPILPFALNEILHSLQEKIKLLWAVSKRFPGYLSNLCIQRRWKYTPGFGDQIIKKHIFVITFMWKIISLFRPQLSVLFTYLRVLSSCSSLRIVWKFLWWFIISWLCLLNAPFASASFVGLGEEGLSRSSFEGSFCMAKCPITIPRAKAATTKTAPIIHARCPFFLNFAFSSATSCIVSKVRISCLDPCV